MVTLRLSSPTKRHHNAKTAIQTGGITGIHISYTASHKILYPGSLEQLHLDLSTGEVAQHKLSVIHSAIS